MGRFQSVNIEKIPEGLTFDDVLLLPRRSSVLPRSVRIDSELLPGVVLSKPLLSAAMDTVTGRELAATMAVNGALGVLHKNVSIPEQAESVRYVKTYDSFLTDQASVDEKGSLLVAAAIGVGELDRARALVDAGVDLLTVDSAHGHSEAVLNTVEQLRSDFSCPIMAGNVATAEAVRDLAIAGVHLVKVGVGPGSICTTRIVSGVGVPQLTALLWSFEEAQKHGVSVIADGGIRYSGDCVKALAAGASAVMVGRLLSGCDEAPGRTLMVNGRRHKSYRGMGSVEAMAAGSASRYGQDGQEDSAKLVPEGVLGLVPAVGALEDLLYQFCGGIKSGLGYIGAANLLELRQRARWVRQSSNSFRESHPHSLEEVKASPNY